MQTMPYAQPLPLVSSTSSTSDVPKDSALTYWGMHVLPVRGETSSERCIGQGPCAQDEKQTLVEQRSR